MKEPLIFDTSVWIDFFKGKDIAEVNLLATYLEKNDEILLIPVIIQEILQGIKEDSQYRQIKDLLSYIKVLEIPSVQAAIGAAELYRSLRHKGITIRKSNDCLIAFYSIQFSVTLVHVDNDFNLISKYSELKIWNDKTAKGGK